MKYNLCSEMEEMTIWYSKVVRPSDKMGKM